MRDIAKVYLIRVERHMVEDNQKGWLWLNLVLLEYYAKVKEEMGCVLHMRLKLLYETFKKAVSNSSDRADTFQVAERMTDGTRDVLSNLRRFSS